MYILIPMSGALIICIITEMSSQAAALKNRTFSLTDTNTYDFLHTTVSALREF